MPRRGRRSRSARLAGVLLLAGVAAGKVVSLSSVETISSAPLSCTLAYNAPMLGCSMGDFSQKTCSLLCRQSIDGIEARIRTTCSNTQARQGSLLSQAQQGGLFAALCGRGSNTDNESRTASITPSRSAIPRPATSTAISFSSETITRRTPVSSPSSPTSTTSIASATSVRAEPSSDRAPPEPTTIPSQTQTSVEQETSTSSEAQRPTLQPGSGGGSPFDFTSIASSAPKKQLSVSGVILGWALAVLLVQR